MPQFSGRPMSFNRFLGAMDQDDPTNLPAGLAPVCRNTDFEQTSAGTRCGFNTTMQGVNKSPITGLLGFVYNPELPTQVFFQMPLLFDLMGTLQREFPVGGGHCAALPEGLFTPPENSHMIAVQAANKAWAAFSNLKVPTAGLACIDPSTLSVNPLGMKPFGWTWQPSTLVYAGEVCTPPTPFTGNGHTYQAQNTGYTGAAAPNFTLTEAGTFVDGGVTWKELTMVITNRIAAPPAPVLTRSPGTGAFPAGRDVYIIITLHNAQGETIGSASSVIVDTAANDAVDVTIPPLTGFPGWSWMQNLQPQYAVTGASVYEADVATGSEAPPQSAYEQVAGGPFALNTTVPVTATAATGDYLPTRNSARLTGGQLPTPDEEPVIARDSGGGAFAAGRDVYVAIAYGNTAGLTPIGPAASIINTLANDAVQVTLTQPALYPQMTVIAVYEADVPTGAPPPPTTAFGLVGTYGPTATLTITGTAFGSPPVTVNGTGTAGNIAADTSTGGPNGSQGYRYAAAMFMNTNETVSGFTQASVVSTIIDEDGWEIAAFNVATGPANVVGRPIAFSVADGTQAGPFAWLGLVDLTVPSQNFVYPQTILSDGIVISATIFLDNVTTSGIFNFTDEYLNGAESEAGNNVDDRLTLMAPPTAVRVDYLKSVNCLCLTGVPGYYSGCVMSIPGDLESFSTANSPIPIASADGERAWGAIEYRGTIYLMRERSGYVITPSTTNPSGWTPTQRWDKVGPCGPRAFDACGKFLIFAHRSGIYRYVDTSPDLMTKEIPRHWNLINWNAAETICCTIDEETHTVRFLVPIGNSTVPNEEIALSYIEGWENPIHYSTYTGKETAMDACRRYSYNDICAFVCLRWERTITDEPPFLDGQEFLPQLDGTFYQTQLCYGSSAADGTVQARTPGIFNDNGAGIDWQYETTSAGVLMMTCKIEGFNLNATGSGDIYASFLASRDMVTDFHEDGSPIRGKELRVKRPISLSPNQSIGITRMVPAKINEYWRTRFTNGKQPNVWCRLKNLSTFVIPFSVARGELDR